jgi:hypothetical protein
MITSTMWSTERGEGEYRPVPSGGKYLTGEEKKGETMEERGKKKGK